MSEKAHALSNLLGKLLCRRVELHTAGGIFTGYIEKAGTLSVLLDSDPIDLLGDGKKFVIATESRRSQAWSRQTERMAKSAVQGIASPGPRLTAPGPDACLSPGGGGPRE